MKQITDVKVCQKLVLPAPLMAPMASLISKLCSCNDSISLLQVGLCMLHQKRPSCSLSIPQQVHSKLHWQQHLLCIDCDVLTSAALQFASEMPKLFTGKPSTTCTSGAVHLELKSCKLLSGSPLEASWQTASATAASLHGVCRHMYHAVAFHTAYHKSCLHCL